MTRSEVAALLAKWELLDGELRAAVDREAAAAGKSAAYTALSKATMTLLDAADEAKLRYEDAAFNYFKEPINEQG